MTKPKGKPGPAIGADAIKARIMGLDTKTMGKMSAGEFMFLREKSDLEGQRKLDYLMRRMEIEGFARGVVREELAKAAAKGRTK